MVLVAVAVAIVGVVFREGVTGIGRSHTLQMDPSQ
jgi:hypothetical protein